MPSFQSPVVGEKRKQPDDPASRKRLALESPGGRSAVGRASGNFKEEYWMIQWRMPQYKKHKTWDGDAVLVLNGIKGTMYDLEGKLVGAGSLNAPGVEEGGQYLFGGKEIGIDHPISRVDYLCGKCFGRGSKVTSSFATPPAPTIQKQFVPLKPSNLATPYKTPTRKVVDLQPVNLLSGQSSTTAQEPRGSKSYWTANWRRPQAKKHKTWDGDAFVQQIGNQLTVISEKGKIIGRKDWDGHPLQSGHRFYAGNKEISLDSPISSSQLPSIAGVEEETSDPEDVSWDRLPLTTVVTPQQDHLSKKENIPQVAAPKNFVPPTSFYNLPPKKQPNEPLHDPDADGAVVMKAPTEEHAEKFNKKGLPIVPVVLDPIVAKHLRPHQIEGLCFLYECVMGLRKHEGQGCILADEMGLGKTLQAWITIALVWTLLKQNPYGSGAGVIGKALIVCPVSLINNWRAEFRKWLGRDRVGVLAGDKDKSQIKQFMNSRVHQVLVIGYEKLRSVINDLTYCNPPIGLIVCDEGHRLKSANNKTSMMFKALRTPRRIILSGTPIQNDLSEFHAMADFCNPGLLDDYNTFRRVYEVPILKSRAPGRTAKELEIGEARSAQLSTIAKSFVLRREATILRNYLPPKYEYVVFVTPSKLQLSMFATILKPEKLDTIIEGSTAESLALIGTLTKVSNSPVLLKAQLDKVRTSKGEHATRPGITEAVKLLPERAQIEDFSLSGKLTALASLLRSLRQHTEEKCILVSHYTSTLNILEAFCKKQSYTYLRLDGQTPAAKRHDYVNAFNKSSQQSHFLFLLSSKAGGVGLNLIGASRLCLVDSDWNPSHDLQSMARIHRDGQKRPVFIYRFLTAGTIDGEYIQCSFTAVLIIYHAEKIFQRQVTKIGLSNSLMGNETAGSKADSFTRRDLRDIFRIQPDTACNTHDLLGCECDVSDAHSIDTSIKLEEAEDDDCSEHGFINASQLDPVHLDKAEKAELRKKRIALAALGEWTHINCLRCHTHNDVHDEILRRLLYFANENDKVDRIGSAKPQSRPDSLLASIDLENIVEMDEKQSSLSVGDVPGGTISFLFEKISTSSLDDVNDKN
ncbi:P-loop containing nucleoside triphosphate hydrolase protein [Boletus edulis BED1]|uniref:P-loop containing nucleoside triphosphate hydrolase protein n=1 Tax=Boletus edulis BED1 TaxID=1328754 RepID=A0AAD4BW94_BOLED|nr:P-loop containing nucleoside triphosphate hydrolase protein [Boletus edulis BED1]